jgi:hypothetical protein
MKIAYKMTLSSGVAYGLSGKILITAVTQEFQTNVHARKMHVETYLSMAQSSVVQASRSVVLPKALKMGRTDHRYKKAVENVAELLKDRLEVDASVYEYILLDGTCRIVSATDANDIGLDKSGDPILSEAEQKSHIKDVYLLAERNLPLSSISSPLFDNNGGAFWRGAFSCHLPMEM